MARRSWDPFREVDALRREVERAFEDFSSWRWPFSWVSFLPGTAARRYPLLNLSEDEDHLYIEALAPGVDPESLDVAIVGDQLRIAGEKSPIKPEIKAEEFHRNERSAGKFVRTTTLPVAVDAGKVSAEYKNGLLLLTLPKAEEVKPKQIEVKVG